MDKFINKDIIGATISDGDLVFHHHRPVKSYHNPAEYCEYVVSVEPVSVEPVSTSWLRFWTKRSNCFLGRTYIGKLENYLLPETPDPEMWRLDCLVVTDLAKNDHYPDTMNADYLNQKIEIGDWVCGLFQSESDLVLGKVVGFYNIRFIKVEVIGRKFDAIIDPKKSVVINDLPRFHAFLINRLMRC